MAERRGGGIRDPSVQLIYFFQVCENIQDLTVAICDMGQTTQDNHRVLIEVTKHAVKDLTKQSDINGFSL